MTEPTNETETETPTKKPLQVWGSNTPITEVESWSAWIQRVLRGD